MKDKRCMCFSNARECPENDCEGCPARFKLEELEDEIRENIFTESMYVLKERGNTMNENLKTVVIVSIDKHEWRENGTYPTSKVYYSDFFETKEEVDAFFEQIDKDFPDNSMRDFKLNHEYLIRYMRFRVDENNPAEFESIKNTARAYKHYSEAVKEVKGEE